MLYRIGAIAGTALTRAEQRQLAAGRVDEIILFARNIVDRPQLKALIRSIRVHAVAVSIDHEGGRVHRFPAGFTGITRWPAAAALMRGPRGLAAVRTAAASMASELADLGFAAFYAPVADVADRAGDAIIGDRSYGADPERAADGVRAFLEGSRGYGIERCVKHFPGHGRFRVDSHKTLPQCGASFEDWRGRDAVPFVAAAQAGVERVMTAHCHWPALGVWCSWRDPQVIQMAREVLGPGIRILTDDLTMGAVSAMPPRYALSAELAAVERAGYWGTLVCDAQALSRMPPR